MIEADPKFALRTDNRIPASEPDRTQVAMLMPQQSQTINHSTELDHGIAAILNNDSVELDSTQETQQELEAVASINSNAIIPAYDSSNDNLTSSTTTVSETVSAVNQFAQKDWQFEKVKKRDTLSQIFNRLGLSSSEAYSLVEVEEAAPLKLIRPGQKIEVVITPSKEDKSKEVLAALRYKLDKFSSLVVLRTDQGFKANIEVKEPTIEHRLAKATIDHSLLGAAKNADIPYDIVYKLASIFGWQIDFARDIQPGDQIALIYEELFLDDEVVGHGQIVAAELLTADKQYRAIRHIDEDNRVTYYAPDGDGIQGSFLRSPIKFARVTSKFSKKRFHPIQKKWKAHKGVDYGAPMKTPIFATGDGVVTLAGSKRGYGKTVIIRHGHKYQTLYAHMNSYAKGIKSGARVKQGDVIGYVGKTGWTTGPHLHYEFRLNGIHQNPLTVELPKSAPIDNKYQRAFKKEAEVWVAALDRAGQIPLAQNDQ
ncbi:MAG: peptidoglycan DD-metalloendopeptidase family protein [Arenicellales bacterium]